MEKAKNLKIYLRTSIKEECVYGDIMEMSKDVPLDVTRFNTFKEIKEAYIKEVEIYLKEFFNKLEKKQFLVDEENIKLEM